MEEKVNRKRTVLVVDDEEDILILLQRRLTSEGYDTYISPNGANIMDIITQVSPDLILLDIHMAGIDGGTICQLIKSNRSTSSIPVIMFSANENIDRVTRQCGADGYIKKPFDPVKFKTMFQQTLERAHTHTVH